MFCHRVIRSWAYLKGDWDLPGYRGAAVLPGCEVMSIHPLYEDVSPKDPDIVLDKDLAGSWSLTDGKCTTTLTVTAKEEIYDFRS